MRGFGEGARASLRDNLAFVLIINVFRSKNQFYQVFVIKEAFLGHMESI